MYPLSKRKRSWFRIFLSVVFVVATPLLILYASGYRLDDAFKIASTGGIFVSAPQSGTAIYIDGELIRKTSAFQKNAFVQNLRPGEYNISVSKDGYQGWEKRLSVFPETVTEGHSFLLKTLPVLVEIKPLISSVSPTATTSATSTARQVKNPEYDQALKLFDPVKTTLINKATSTDVEKILRNLSVLRDENVLRVAWLGDDDEIPGYFCQNEICKKEIVINSDSKLKHFDFFPGREDLVVISTDTGIYVSEIDDRSMQNVQKIIEGTGYDFRILEGDRIYIKKDKQVFLVDEL